MHLLMYIIGICLMASTEIAMQQLLDLCNDLAVLNDIKCSSLKTVCLLLGIESISYFVPLCRYMQIISDLCFVKIQKDGYDM